MNARRTNQSVIPHAEGETVEFKSSFNQDAIVALVAFANTSGGSVYIGVNDRGVAVGVTLSPEAVRTWVNEIKSKTAPSLVPSSAILHVDGRTVVLLHVPEFPVKPIALQGRYYRRSGRANHVMSFSELTELYLQTFASSWDYYIDDQHGLEDISLEKVAKFARAVNPDQSEDPLRVLRKMELVRDGKISKAAYLLFATDYASITDVQIGRFKGSTTIIDSLSLNADLFSEVDAMLAFIKKHLMISYVITGKAKRDEVFDYPVEAIREIVLNMVVHRDYRESGLSVIKIFDGRIEFFNPGGLSSGLTVQKLLSDDYSPTSRNKLIALAFKEAGLVERFGSGIHRIVASCKRHGGSKVVFTSDSQGFKVILSKTDLKTDLKTGEWKAVLLRLMKNNPSITLPEIANQMGKGITVTKGYVATLKREKCVHRVGGKKGGRWEVR